MLGFAFQIKFLAVFDIFGVVIGLFLLLRQRKETQIIQKWAIGTLVLAVFPLLFLIGVGGYYYFIGHFSDFYFANFTSNQIYGAQYSFHFPTLIMAFAEQIGGPYFIWFGSIATFILLLLKKQKIDSRDRILILVIGFWILLDIPGICLSKQYWAHYFIQLYPALCILTALVILELMKPVFKNSQVQGAILLGLLLVGPFRFELIYHLKASFQAVKDVSSSGVLFSDDTPTEISRFIADRTTAQDFTFMVDVTPVIYILSKTKIPTKYAFPPFLIGVESSVVAGIDPQQELATIMAKEPVFIVKKNQRPDPEGTLDSYYEKISEHLNESYHLVKTINGIDVFERLHI